MNLKTEHFRIFILLNIISLFIKLLKEVLDIDFELTNTNTKIILMISINIAIFILSKTKKISTKNNLIISLIVIFLGYFVISSEYYPFRLNSLTFGLNFLVTLIIVYLNRNYDLIKITKKFSVIYFLIIVLMLCISFKIANDQNYVISRDIKFEYKISIKDFILPLLWLMIVVFNKTLISKIIEKDIR